MPKRRKARKPAPRKSRPRKGPPKPWKRERRVYIFPCVGGHDGRTYSKAKARVLVCRKCERKRQHPDQLDIFGRTVKEAAQIPRCRCGGERTPSEGTSGLDPGYRTVVVGLLCTKCDDLEIREERSEALES